MFDEFQELIRPMMEVPLKYTERAEREIKKAHFNDEMVKKILLNPKKIDVCYKNTFIVHGLKTAKIKVEIIENNYLLVHWFEYNKVMFVC